MGGLHGHTPVPRSGAQHSQFRRPCCPHRYALQLRNGQAFSLACWVNVWLIIMDDRHRGAAVSRKVVGLIPDVKVDVSLTPRPGAHFQWLFHACHSDKNRIYQKMVESVGIFALLLEYYSIIKHIWCIFLGACSRHCLPVRQIWYETTHCSVLVKRPPTQIQELECVCVCVSMREIGWSFNSARSK